jgi:hypothetical protein
MPGEPAGDNVKGSVKKYNKNFASLCENTQLAMAVTLIFYYCRVACLGCLHGHVLVWFVQVTSEKSSDLLLK